MGNRDAKEQPNRLHLRLLRDHHGFRWHIWWMVGLSALGAYATFVVFAWRDKDEYIIPAETVARIDRANRSARSVVLARRQATP
jgi:hypothetical protein